MKKLRMLSLCSGIGGADLAAEWTGAIEIVGQVEIDPFCQQVLTKHWPETKRMGDIREVQGYEFGQIDIIVAGFPCQPHSLSGKRKGSQDERNLWPEIARIISAAHPGWIVGENVSGLLSSESGRFFGSILRDLDALGYRVGWCVYGAGEIGAPHKRDRVFLVAYSSGIGQRTRRAECQGQQRTIQPDGSNSSYSYLADTDSDQCGIQRQGIWPNVNPDREKVAHTSSDRRGNGTDQQKQSDGTRTPDARIYGPLQPMAHTDSQRQQECDTSTGGSESRLAARRVDTAMAHTNRDGRSLPSSGQHTTEQILECSTQRAAQSCMGRNAYGFPCGLDGHRWPAGPCEKQEAWEPPRVITEKQKYRNQRLKALGNAIVPQQIFPVFQTIAEWEQRTEVRA